MNVYAAFLLVTAFCVQHTTGAEDEPCVPEVTELKHRQGSFNGGQRLVIAGKCFAKNQFNFGAGNEHLGNEVTMVSDDGRSYECDIHKDGCTEFQITCNTRPMVDGTYFVRVSVDGTTIPLEKTCARNENMCKFTPKQWRTPRIREVDWDAKPPESILTMKGRIITEVYGSNKPAGRNGKAVRILRSYAGPGNCELTKRETVDELHGIALDGDGNTENGVIKCRVADPYVGNLNASFLIEEGYGRSMPDMSTLHVRANGQISMIQTHAVVDSVTPTSGGNLGGTQVEITGNFFEDKKTDVYVGGSKCDVESVTNTKITCITGPEATTGNLHPGNRGIRVHWWNKDRVQGEMDDIVADIKTLTPSGDNHWSDILPKTQFVNGTDHYVSRMYGFYCPPVTGEYRFMLKGDDFAQLHLSTDHTAANLAKVAELKSNQNDFTMEAASDRITLTGGQCYYMQHFHAQQGGGGHFTVAVNQFTTKLAKGMASEVRAEKHEIKIESRYQKEIQTLHLKDLNTRKGTTQEKQKIEIAADATHFQIELFGAMTKKLPKGASSKDVKGALKSLPICTGKCDELKVENAGSVYTVTFPTALGDVADMDIRPSGAGTVQKMVDGEGSATTVQLQIGKVVSEPISATAGAEAIKGQIYGMLSVRCPAEVLAPKQSSNWKIYEGFEDKDGDEFATDVLPFCGLKSLKNTETILTATKKAVHLSVFKSICLAYMGPIQPKLSLKFQFSNQEKKGAPKEEKTIEMEIPSPQSGWNFACVDAVDAIDQVVKGRNYYLRELKIHRAEDVDGDFEDIYVDNVYVGKEKLSDMTVWGDLPSMRVLPKETLRAEKVEVEKLEAGKFKITIDHHPLSKNFPLISVHNGVDERSSGTERISRQKGWPATAAVHVTRVNSEKGTPPVTGTFGLTFKGKKLADVDSQSTAEDVKDIFDTNSDQVGHVTITRTGTERGFTWTVEFTTLPGDQPELVLLSVKIGSQVDGSNLIGTDVNVAVKTLANGGLFYESIPSEFLRTEHTKPQVQVFVNKIPSTCDGTCDFEWHTNYPTVSAFTPTTVSKGTTMTVTGTGFDSGTVANNVIQIGDHGRCIPTEATSTTFKCTVGNAPAGSHDIQVLVLSSGQASVSNGLATTIIYTASITDIQPRTAKRGGGEILTITGGGFHEKGTTVKIDNVLATVIGDVTMSEIKVDVPNGQSVGSVDVIVNTNGVEVTSPNQLEYVTPTAIVSSISATTASVEGTTEITIAGTGFGDTLYKKNAMKIGDKVIEKERIKKYSSTEIVVVLPPMPTGSYKLHIQISRTESADLSENNIADITYEFSISDISSATCSLRGNLPEVEFTGKGFPSDIDLYKVRFGDIRAEVISATTTKVVAKLKKRNVVHKVKNTGSTPENGERYAWDKPRITIGYGESVLWKWSSPKHVRGVAYRVCQTKGPDSKQCLKGGFDSVTKSGDGEFYHRFDQEGTYYYWTTWQKRKTTLRGVVIVEKPKGAVLPIVFEVNGIQATAATAGVSRRKRSSSCPVLPATIPGCTEEEPDASVLTADFTFNLSPCSTPAITNALVEEDSSFYKFTMTGTGFGSDNCHHAVTFAGTECAVQSSSATQIVCHLSPSTNLKIGAEYTMNGHLDLVIANRGEAQPQLADAVQIFKPKITNIVPLEGSIHGGTKVVISGLSLYDDVSTVTVIVGSQVCDIKTKTANEITCNTRPSPEGTQADIVVDILDQSGKTHNVKYKDKFLYKLSATPTVAAANPTNVETGTTLSVTGTKFGTDTSQIEVRFDSSTCAVTALSDTSITCTVENAVVGTHDLVVRVMNKGVATSTQEVTVASTINSLTPNSGSTEGGLSVIVDGVGFLPLDTAATLDGANVPLTDVTHTSFKFITPKHAVGSVDLVVTSNGQEYPPKQFTFSGSATPNVASIASVSDGIVLTGTNFHTDQAKVSVHMCEKECTVLSATLTSVKVTPCYDCPPGAYEVKLHVQNKGFATIDASVANFLSDRPPSVTSFTPTQGSPLGGQRLTISGLNFDVNFSEVKICEQVCAVDKDASSQSSIVCSTPPAANTAADASCDLKVTVGELVATASSQYQFKVSLKSEITSFTPNRGGTSGGTVITIAGTFVGVTGTGSVLSLTVAGSVCPVQTASASSITCRTGQVAKPVDGEIVIRTGDGSVTSSTKYLFMDVWSSKYTWGGDDPPEEGSLVVVQKGQTLMLDQDTPKLKMLLIKGGTLLFDKKDITLNTENILITEGGKFQIGTEEEPHLHKATVIMHGQLRATELPIYGAKTLAVREGTLDLHGKPIKKTWTKLGATADVGATTINLIDEVDDWTVGDEIVLASTGFRHSQEQNEQRTITAISANKKTLTLNEALKFKHLGEKRTYEGVELDMRGEVGLLTRNIVFKGSDNKQWHDKIEACPDGFNPGEFATQTCFQGRFGEEQGSDQFGAQIMLHAPSKDADVVKARISYTEVTYAGQAFRLGRYPIHFHLNGDMTGTYVKGCAIHHTFNRAINTHDSHNIVLEHNVVFDVMGGAVFLEDGSEHGNVWRHNLAVFVKASTSLLNDDITPAAFWITNPDNTVENNVAAGGTHFGFWYRMHNHPDGPSFTTDVCPKKIPVKSFKGNTVHSVGWFGLWVFQEYFPTATGACDSNDYKPAVFDSLTVWNSDKGAEWVHCGAMHITNSLFFNNHLAGFEGKLIANGKTQRWNEFSPTVSDTTVIGHVDEIQTSATSCMKRGIILPFGEGMIIKNTKLIDFDRDTCAGIGICIMDGRCGQDCGGFTTKFSGIQFIRANRKGSFRNVYEGVWVDEDGSLGGTAGASITPTHGALPTNCAAKADFSFGDAAASSCPSPTRFVRFALNHAPQSTYGKDLIQVNRYGTSESPYAKKKVTHKEGWMLNVLANEKTEIKFADVLPPVNLSFTGKVYALKPDEHVILQHKLSKEPDRVQFTKGDPKEITAGTVSSSDDFQTWHYHNEMVQYNVPGKAGSAYKDRNLDFHAYRCKYPDCVVPPPGTITVDSARPTNATMWSDKASWTNVPEGWGGFVKNGDNNVPAEGDDVMITQYSWVVVDTKLPKMKKLFIYGTLEFDDTRDHLLEAEHVYIFGGRLIGGWPDAGKHFKNKIEIVLHGDKTSKELDVGDGVAIGAKALAVFGGLDLHGKPSGTQWTHLKETAAKGSNQLKLAYPVEWVVGDEIMITTTGLDPWQTEVLKITATDGTTLTLDGSLKNDHLVGSLKHAKLAAFGKELSIAAEVGLLSHNVKIRGEGGEYKDGFGCRILIGSRGDEDVQYTDIKGVVTQGFARMTNVEIAKCGQYNFRDTFDPRFAVAFLDVGANALSVFKNNSIKNSYNSGVGGFGMSALTLENNVMYDIVGSGINLEGGEMVVKNNLIAGVRFTGTFAGRSDADKDYPAGIKVNKAVGVVLQDNTVAGSERSGFQHSGLKCNDETRVWKNNVGHSLLLGSYQLPTDGQTECTKIAGFTHWQVDRYGIWMSVRTHVIVENVIVSDAAIASFVQIIGGSPVNHAAKTSYATYEDVLFIGHSGIFPCGQKLPAANYVSTASTSDPWYRRVGLGWTSFTAGPNQAPKKTFHNEMAYPSMHGRTYVKKSAFANYGDNCGRKDYAIVANPAAEDTTFPIETSELVFVNTPEDNRVFFQRAVVGKVNPSDCVDMVCDATLNALIVAKDNTLMGASGNILPQAEWNWDGDARYGLGDYRIPKYVLTDVAGNRIDVNTIAPKKGIVGHNDCQYVSSWQAYKCTGNVKYGMLVFESMDADTEMRRLSPVSVISDKYTWLLNGPQDHGWCLGYTCQKRVSVFYSLVAVGKHHAIYLTSKPPRTMRFHFQDMGDNDRISVSLYYPEPQRIDVYAGDKYVDPTNRETNRDGKPILQVPHVNTPDQYLPSLVNGKNGDNYFDRSKKEVFFIIKGTEIVDIKVAEAIIVSLTMPAMTADEFFGKEIINNLAALLGVDPSKVRLMNPIAETSVSRRKRSATMTVIIEIGDPPAADKSNADKATSMKVVNDKLIEAYQTQDLPVKLNTQLYGMTVTYDIGDDLTDATNTIKVPSTLHLMRSTDNSVEMNKFANQPTFRFKDQSAIYMNYVGTSNSPWEMTATLLKGAGSHASAELIGTKTITFANGWANFTDLGISHSGDDYKLKFTITKPSGVNFKAEMAGIRVNRREVKVGFVNQKEIVAVGQRNTFQAEFQDVISDLRATNLDWRGHTWSVRARVYSPGLASVTLVRPRVDVNTGLIELPNAVLTEQGMYLIQINVSSSPADYSFTATSPPIRVHASSYTKPTAAASSIFAFKIEENMNQVVGDKTAEFAAVVWNKFGLSNLAVSIGDISVQAGSIAVSMTVSGSSASVDEAVRNMWNDIQDGVYLTYNGYTLYIEPSSVRVNGRPYGQEETNTLIIIIPCVVAGAVLIVIVAAVAIYCILKNKKRRDAGKDGDSVSGDAPPPYAEKDSRFPVWFTNSDARGRPNSRDVDSGGIPQLLSYNQTIYPASPRLNQRWQPNKKDLPRRKTGRIQPRIDSGLPPPVDNGPSPYLDVIETPEYRPYNAPDGSKKKKRRSSKVTKTLQTSPYGESLQRRPSPPIVRQMREERGIVVTTDDEIHGTPRMVRRRSSAGPRPESADSQGRPVTAGAISVSAYSDCSDDNLPSVL